MLPGDRSHTNFGRVVVWLLIAATAGLAVYLQKARSESDDAPPPTAEALHAADEGLGELDSIPTQSQLVGKLTIAMHGLAPTVDSKQVLAQAESLKQGGFKEQLGYSVLVGSIDGWSAGVEYANGLALPSKASVAAKELRDEVVAAMAKRIELAADGDEEGKGAVAEVAALKPKLGFFAEALGPDAVTSSAATMVVLLAVGGWYLLVFLGGVIALVVLLVLAMRGTVRPAIRLADNARTALVLGETFALWLATYLAVNLLSALFILPALADAGENAQLCVSIGMMLSSLVVLVYPAYRGVGWTELRALVGLHCGKGVPMEVLQGLLCYISAVPILLLGVIVYAILSAIDAAINGQGKPPSHPVVDLLAHATGWQIVLLLLLASVVAPIVEEIMFRGFLYGHLRGSILPQARVVSMLISAVASSTVFAIVHPQGVLFVPALGGLAVGFCLYREMRGSLIAPMVAHGVNNAVTLTIGLTLLS